MKAIYDLPAPAKLNLFLHITGRRDDGYHLLQSVFMLIDWCDTLHVELRRDGQLSREDLTTELPPDDLVLRAARALQIFAAPGQGAHIGVAKHVPAQAGMGGGSSDAATCLLALNRLWGLNLPLSRLAHIGLKLGADVPFFLGGRNAWVEGVGEQLTPVTLLPAHFAVVKPPEGLDTRLIFSATDLERSTPVAIITGFAAESESLEATNLKNSVLSASVFDFGHNDLQPVAQRLCPAVTDAIEWLGAQGLKARMTGSGSSVFAKLPQAPQEAELLKAPKGWQVRQCSNLEVHPLCGWAT
ncbi:MULTISPECIES: 4-(cytidine 5'-diphospho)-2-C-methyl-D-erythritol kinase [unclassified Variovorax]|uniref:4-(cytidine 5'-diphospho)-2-C-methyl-D-erythritol kinase n=1 Tax=unclassified Variovorax TaxID=663243 RepID=UPI0008C76F57|nr:MULTISPECIES: 4-(cytidine 5'-diphospho)-2-C-methyl-D-erythritol kinase [unclassified Variovorax]SEK14066.1 4-diphosphocytidyl-2-C-methyl-D-erythritol kinase [Variovorax sp. OK202]SFD94259.1 4-diphosphocytidyl-2-C-methyl-D-erythritol kinase [Variovorax sp. OK212]